MKVEMYWADHAAPHIHVRHGGDVVVVDIRSAQIAQGRLAKGPKKILLQWVLDHTDDLLNNWDRGEALVPLEPIDPPE